MTEISHLLSVADAFKKATGLEDVTLSHRLFSDSKKLAALRKGADITVGRFNSSMLWFSTNWPEGALCPSGVARPVDRPLRGLSRTFHTRGKPAENGRAE